MHYLVTAGRRLSPALPSIPNGGEGVRGAGEVEPICEHCRFKTPSKAGFDCIVSA